MYALLENQVLGIDGWVNVSNIVFLVAFSTRDVLVLRILALVGEGLILPYYYLQAETLWQPIFWSLAFMAVNAVRIVATVLERRPVILSEKEEQLYRVAFSSVDKREFLKLPALPDGSTARQVRSSSKKASRFATPLSSFPGKWRPFSAASPGWRFDPVN